MSQKINSLQLLRAVAVSLVIFVHASYYGVPKISAVNPVDSFYNLKQWGNLGVDLFFAISGFIMTIIYESYIKPSGWKTFFMKRIIRIVPLYYLLSCLDAFITIFIHHQSVSAPQIVKTLFFFPILDINKFVVPLISVGWSLSYEMYFYTIIGIALLFKKYIPQLVLVTLFSLGILGFFWNSDIVLLKFLTSPLLLEFAFGIACGLIYRRFLVSSINNYQRKILALGLTISGVILMSLSFFMNVKWQINYQTVIENDNVIAFYRTIIWGIPTAIFMLGVILLEKSFQLKTAPILILAGDASYSCYLIHGMVYPVVASVFKYLSLGPILYLVVIIPICIGVSIIFYKIIEKPLVSGIDKLLKYRLPVTMK